MKPDISHGVKQLQQLLRVLRFLAQLFVTFGRGSSSHQQLSVCLGLVSLFVFLLRFLFLLLLLL